MRLGVFVVVVLVLLCLLQNIWVALPGYGTAAARAALPIPISVCSIFCVFKQWYGCQCVGFLTCAQMLMHVIAHGGLKSNCAHTSHPSHVDHSVRWQSVVSIIDVKGVIPLQVQHGKLQGRVVLGGIGLTLHCDNAQSHWQHRWQRKGLIGCHVARVACTKN